MYSDNDCNTIIGTDDKNICSIITIEWEYIDLLKRENARCARMCINT